MLQKEFEWKIRFIIEKTSEVLDVPELPDYLRETLDDIKEMAQSIQNEVNSGNIKFPK
jgi:hypothetical protein